jgi:hypothetical protein
LKLSHYPTFFLLASLLLLIGTEQTLAIVPGYVPVSAAWLREHQFPMRTVGRFLVSKVPSRLPLANRDIWTTSTARVGSGMAVSIHGCALDGTRWEAMVSGGCSTDAFVLSVADLDENGQQDVIMTFRLATTGRESVFEHLMLLFDANGLPTPFSTVGCCLDESALFLDFVDLDGDGRAEVFDQHQENGVWGFDIYSARNSRWQRVSRWPALDSVPMALRNRPCGTMPARRSLDTARFIDGGNLHGFHEDEEGNTCLVFSETTGATGTARLLHAGDSHCIMLVETPAQRRILFSSAHGDDWQSTLGEIVSSAPRFFRAGDLMTHPRNTRQKVPSPMIAWFFAGFPQGPDSPRIDRRTPRRGAR